MLEQKRLKNSYRQSLAVLAAVCKRHGGDDFRLLIAQAQHRYVLLSLRFWRSEVCWRLWLDSRLRRHPGCLCPQNLHHHFLAPVLPLHQRCPLLEAQGFWDGTQSSAMTDTCTLSWWHGTLWETPRVPRRFAVSSALRQVFEKQQIHPKALKSSAASALRWGFIARYLSFKFNLGLRNGTSNLWLSSREASLLTQTIWLCLGVNRAIAHFWAFHLWRCRSAFSLRWES